MTTKDSNETRQALRESCPRLFKAVTELAEDWLAPVQKRIEAISNGLESPLRVKHVNDPIWRTFELEPQEVLLLDSPLIQRMRGVKQLGLANLVFPGANHDRFEHICGTVQAAERVFQAIRRNAERRRPVEESENRPPPTLTDSHRLRLRLAALLHDVGHGPFSHAIEPVVTKNYAAEVKSFNREARNHLQLDSKIAVAEIISVLISISDPLEEVLRYLQFSAASPDDIIEIQLQIATLILGARRPNQLACLSAIISGQVDADKMDYMARDALHSGMPIEFDTERLLSKLEIIRCTPENLPASQRSNREFAENSPNNCYYDLGVSASGVGALEQMLIGRAFLYDRLYHHHKVRAADAMAQRMLHYAQASINRPYELRELYQPVSDDTLIRLFAGEISKSDFPDAGAKAEYLGKALLARDLYVRAFAFRASFHTAGMVEQDEQCRNQELADAWSPVSTALADFEDRLDVECDIVSIAKRIARSLGGSLAELGEQLDTHHVIVDLAENRVKPVTINVHFNDGSLEAPNLFFDPARWSHVYDLQKRTGYVFCHREYLPLVGVAAKILFFDRWGYATTEKADRLTKTASIVKSSDIERLVQAGEIDDLAAAVLRHTSTIRTFIRECDISWPENWHAENADLDREIIDKLRIELPQGLPTEDRDALIKTIECLSHFIFLAHQGRALSSGCSREKDLQRAFISHLQSSRIAVTEGAEMGGGETDVIIQNRILVENKHAGVSGNPFGAAPTAPYQANRYSVALCSRVFCTLIAYKPLNDGDPLEQTASIEVEKISDLSRAVVNIRAVVPYGMKVPSKVTAPKPAPQS